MLQSAWLFIGLVAVLATTGAVLTTKDEVGMVLGIMGTLSWWMWTYASFEVTIVDGGVEFVFSQPIAAVFGVLVSLLPLYIALTGPIELAKQATGTHPDDL